MLIGQRGFCRRSTAIYASIDWTEFRVWWERQHSGKTMMKNDEQYSPEETARRRDDAIRRALNTPPIPQKDMVGKVGDPNQEGQAPITSC